MKSLFSKWVVLAAAAYVLLRAGATAAAGQDWLVRLNRYRATAGVKPVGVDEVLSQGDTAHAQYLVKNYAAVVAGKQAVSVDLHVEERSKPGFTYAGFVAGRASDIEMSAGPRSPAWAIDQWMIAPFHRFPLLNPDLDKVGYGDFCDHQVCAAALNLGSDSMSSALMLRRRISSGVPITGESEALGGGWGTAYSHPIKFPSEGATIDYLSFLSGEWPNPLSSCPGYSAPSGLPITIQFGRWMTPKVSSSSLRSGGKTLDACAFDASNYSNPDELTQKLGRRNLEAFGAVMLVPRAPLQAGTTYEVSMRVQDVDYKWSFSTASGAGDL